MFSVNSAKFQAAKQALDAAGSGSASHSSKQTHESLVQMGTIDLHLYYSNVKTSEY